MRVASELHQVDAASRSLDERTLIGDHPTIVKLRTLVENRDEAILYRQLATLIDTVPLGDTLDDLKFKGVPRARFERWCDELGVERLKLAPKRWQ